MALGVGFLVVRGLSSASGWGWSLVRWAWWVVLSGRGCCYSLRGRVSHPRGPDSPLCGRVFLGFSIGVGCDGLLSHLKFIKKNS